MISFFTPGIPMPKGSHFIRRGRIADSANRKTNTRAAGALDLWQDKVGWCARKEMRDLEVFEGAVAVSADFYILRPASHLKKDGKLRKGKPIFPVYKPDIDKLLRAVCDAMSGIVYADDCQVVSINSKERYINEVQPLAGVEVSVREIISSN